MMDPLSEQANPNKPPDQEENAAKDDEMRSPRRRERGKNGGDDELTVAWNYDDAKTQGKNKGSQMQLHLSG
jgi:hypothetical protein